MSHFTTLVLLQNPNGDIESEISEALAPFDENLEVPEYQADCHCIGQVAFNEATKKAGEKYGTLDDLRKSFKDKKDKSDEAWKEHIKPYQEYRDKLIAEHPMKNKPDPTCGFYTEQYCPDGHQIGERFEDGSGCGGTGKYLTTYNPNSKWDWWTIGGRWQGDLDPDYDSEKDERNWETCWVCEGTGMRNDALGIEHRRQDPDYKCNGCQGKGRKLKWTLAPHDKGNIKPVSEILDYAPFAIVTPDGCWHEKGNMGWWGIVTDEEDNWPAIAKRILQEHQSCVAVLCDLHI